MSAVGWIVGSLQERDAALELLRVPAADVQSVARDNVADRVKPGPVIA